jgi:hypothetical protein
MIAWAVVLLIARMVQHRPNCPSLGPKMGQFVLHRSERRRVAAICAAALNEREALARRKALKPPSSQRVCREFTHENDSYRDLFWGSARSGEVSRGMSAGFTPGAVACFALAGCRTHMVDLSHSSFTVSATGVTTGPGRHGLRTGPVLPFEIPSDTNTN